MIGHRMSVLGLTRYCSVAGLLSAQHGASVEALMSQAYHARCAQTEGWQDLMDRLPADLRAAVAAWPPPPVTQVPDLDGIVHDLDYGEATVEHTVRLDRLGFSTNYPDSAVTEGHLDMMWAPLDSHTVFVGDIKRTKWTVPEFEESLQLHAYGIAAATMLGRKSYRIGIWTPMEELWWWDDHCVVLDSLEGARRQRSVVAAATNTDGGAIRGPHCANCYGRFHCAELLLPAALGATKLKAVAEGHGELTNEDRLAAVLELTALDTLLAVAKPTIQAMSDRNPIVDPATGKAYYGRPRQGRESVAVSKLREALGKDAEPYISRGPPSLTHRWYNDLPKE